ncbi:MAG: hypothetical protein RLZZ176_2656 [Cyanobacteriota bacterium]
MIFERDFFTIAKRGVSHTTKTQRSQRKKKGQSLHILFRIAIDILGWAIPTNTGIFWKIPSSSILPVQNSWGILAYIHWYGAGYLGSDKALFLFKKLK